MNGSWDIRAMNHAVVQNIRLCLSVFVALSAAPAFSAGESLSHAAECRPTLWIAIQNLAKRSALEKTDLHILSDRTATVKIEGRTFAIELLDSEFADEGDLNDVIATEVDGTCRLELRAVPAFGDLLDALGVNRPTFTFEDLESQT